jgi:hypothetical protein
MNVDFSVVVLQKPASNQLKPLSYRDRGIHGFEPGTQRQHPIST